MSDNQCAHCGRPLQPGVAEGICPRCLFDQATDPGQKETTPDTEPSGSGAWVPPKVEILAALFPELEVFEMLGRGGMGAVYKVRQKNLDRVAALKVLPRQVSLETVLARRFVRESQAMAKLNDPHIVTVYDSGQREGLFYFLMEFVDGMNLRQWMDANKNDATGVLRIVPQVCKGLQYAHERGIVHRDIKPENILLNLRGQAKIADFGIAKLLGELAQTSTTADQVIGTPRYMAPEQLERPTEVDHRADIYSLGVLMYQMLTGGLPIGRFPPPSQSAEMDARLDDVVLRMLEKDPDHRYQTARDIGVDLAAITGSAGESPASNQLPQPDQQSTTPASSGRRPLQEAEVRRQYRDKWIALGFLLLAALSFAGWTRMRVDSTIEPLLPDNSDASRAVQFLNNSTFGSRIMLWLRLSGEDSRLKNNDIKLQELYKAEDQIKKRLEQSPVKPSTLPAVDDPKTELQTLLDDAGELLSKKEMDDLPNAVMPDAIKAHLKSVFINLAGPPYSIEKIVAPNDPLGVKTPMLSRFLRFVEGTGFRAHVQGGRLMHDDGTQLLMPLESTVNVNDATRSRDLVQHLNSLASDAPPGVQVIPICGLIHFEANGRIMKSDAIFLGVLDAILFFLIFIFVSHDFRVALLFITPLISAVLVLGLFGLACDLCQVPVPAIVIGISLIMAVSAVDFGIVYSFATMSSDTATEVKRVRRPLYFVQLSVFLSLVFSSTPAYRQLGWVLSAFPILTLLAAVHLLPNIIRPGDRISALGKGIPLSQWGAEMVPAVVAGTLLTILGIFFCRHAAFDSDLTRIDGSDPVVIQNEQDFQRTWSEGGRGTAMLVATGNTLDDAEEASENLYGQVSQISQKLPDFNLVSLSSFWPSEKTREENHERWHEFWKPEKVISVRAEITSAGKRWGFADDQFDPFFKSLTDDPPSDKMDDMLAPAYDQFTSESTPNAPGRNQWQMLSFFPETRDNIARVRQIIQGQRDTFVVSPDAVGQDLADSASSDTKLLVPLCTGLVLITMLVVTRSVAKSLVVLIPAVTGVAAMLVTLHFAGLPIIFVTVIVVILILALGSQYGYLVLLAWDKRERLMGQWMATVHFSALATAVGTAAMMFAHHPALIVMGVSLTSGIVGAYVGALFIVPGVCHLLSRREPGLQRPA